LNANISGIGKGDIPESDIAQLIALFEHAKTFGSLIQIPEEMVSKLPAIEERLRKVEGSGDLSWMGLMRLQPLIQQAKMLAQKYDAVVANPPYMGSKYLAPMLKVFLKKHYLGFEKDLFSVFMVRDITITKRNGNLGFMSPFVWMFISSYEELRNYLIEQVNITSLVQLEYSGFDGATVPICTFTLANNRIEQAKGSFIKLSNFKGSEQQAPKTLEAIRNKSCGWFYEAKPDDFKKIPGSPIAYWVSKAIANLFAYHSPLSKSVETREGLTTGSNESFLRFWYEVSIKKVGFSLSTTIAAAKSKYRWFPHLKGGGFRRWSGNFEYVVDWENDGERARNFKDLDTGRVRSHNYNGEYGFREGLTWSGLSSGVFAVRFVSSGYMFDAKAPMAFAKDTATLNYVLLFLNSTVAGRLIEMLAPTLDFKIGHVLNLPLVADGKLIDTSSVVNISRTDWDSFETSWDFKTLPVLQHPAQTLAKSQEAADIECLARFAQMKQLEEENNRLFIDAYGLQDELSPDVPDDQITLHRPDREQDIKRLISYAIGCMMGRYSLDKEGLIYANSGNDGFDPTQYKTYPADEDGIIPVLNHDWGIADDATARTVEFIKVLWPKEYLEENLFFISQSLGATPKEPSREVIRNYFSTSFYKDHLQKYKKRPIYWLFSSGKLRAFQCLVYLHRYNEGTLSRMRTEYVIPIQSRIIGRIEQLEGDKLKATSTSHRNKLQKEQNDLKKQQEELKSFEEKLKHAAERKIKLDLDDGVKVNYAKFTDKKYGEILAEVKAITGGSEE
jgi:hypothetical protein